MTPELRSCKRCLLYEMAEADQYKNIYEYIESLPADMKADDKMYKERLDICHRCDNLFSGMCRICGCFVEVRAAKRGSYCPCTEKYW